MNKIYKLGYDSSMIGVDFEYLNNKYKNNSVFLKGYLDYIKERKEENKVDIKYKNQKLYRN